jgi:hypothetical protein
VRLLWQPGLRTVVKREEFKPFRTYGRLWAAFAFFMSLEALYLALPLFSSGAFFANIARTAQFACVLDVMALLLALALQFEPIKDHVKARAKLSKAASKYTKKVVSPRSFSNGSFPDTDRSSPSRSVASRAWIDPVAQALAAAIEFNPGYPLPECLSKKAKADKEAEEDQFHNDALVIVEERVSDEHNVTVSEGEHEANDDADETYQLEEEFAMGDDSSEVALDDSDEASEDSSQLEFNMGDDDDPLSDLAFANTTDSQRVALPPIVKLDYSKTPASDQD